MVVVNINGKIFSQDAPSMHLLPQISVFDRAYLYGDSLYEVARTYHRKLYALEEHLIRLEQSAQLAHIKLSQKRSQLAEAMKKATAYFFEQLPKLERDSTEAYCRIIISRGIGKIGFGHSFVETPTLFTIIVQKLNPPNKEQFQKGYSMRVVDRHRNSPLALTPAMKSGNYLNSLLAFIEATEHKFKNLNSITRSSDHTNNFSRFDAFDDALLCDSRGFITEGTTFNVFYVKRGILATSPFDVGILDGITRKKVIQIAQKNNIEVREVLFPKERLYEADEVFLTSTIKEVFPITQIDHVLIGQNTPHKRKPGPITQKLAKLFSSEVQKTLAKK